MLKKLFSFSTLLWVLIILAIFASLVSVFLIDDEKEAFCNKYPENCTSDSDCCGNKKCLKNTNIGGHKECQWM